MQTEREPGPAVGSYWQAADNSIWRVLSVFDQSVTACNVGSPPRTTAMTVDEVMEMTSLSSAAEQPVELPAKRRRLRRERR